MCQQSVWSQPTAQQLNPTTEVREVSFGYDVAFFGDMLLVAAPGDSEKAPLWGISRALPTTGTSRCAPDFVVPD